MPTLLLRNKNRKIALDNRTKLAEVYDLGVLGHFGPKGHSRKINKTFKSLNYRKFSDIIFCPKMSGCQLYIY